MHNDSDEQFGPINLVTATAHSVNTVFVQLGVDVGVNNVIRSARAAGLPTSDVLSANASMLLGSDSAHPIDQAASYATFAANGTYAAPHFVQEVHSATGKLLYSAKVATRAAFTPAIASNVTYALSQVISSGTGTQAAIGRPAAGKTGTTSGNVSAWFVGYTPQLSTAVAMFRDGNAPLQGIAGYSQIYGGTLPAKMWSAFMTGALAGQPVQQFPARAPVGVPLSPSPTPTATPTPSSTACPTPGPATGSGAPVLTGCPTASLSPSPSATVTTTPSGPVSSLSPTGKPTHTPKPKPTTTPKRTPTPKPTATSSGRPRFTPTPRRRARRRGLSRLPLPGLLGSAVVNANADVTVVPPTHDDPVVRGASTVIGGPLGRHHRPSSSWWTPLRVMLALTFAVFALGYLLKAPCLDGQWNGKQYTHVCYSDTFALYGAEGLAAGKIPYLDHPVEYPVIIGAVMEAGSRIAHLFPSSEQNRWFFDINAVLFALCAAATVVATAKTSGRRPWDAAMVALAPGLMLTGLINWDLLAVALTSFGLLLWSRRHPAWAGVLLGLAVATKFYPIVLFGALFLLCVRGRQMRAFWVALLAAVGAWVVVDLPVWLAAPTNFGKFYAFSQERGADWGSIWYAYQQITHHSFDVGGAMPEHLNFLATVSFAVLFLGIAGLTWFAPRRPRLPQVCFLVLAGFLLVNKVYSPQYVLWLLPLAVLARPRWRSFLVWQAAEVVYFVAIWWYLYNVTVPGKGLSVEPYLAAVGLRDLAVVFLCALVVRDVLRPDGDVVRADGVDDPAGGVLDGAPDRFQLAREDPSPAHQLA